MKLRTLHRKLGTGVLLTALAGLAPGVALADNFVGTDFQALASKAQSAPEFDYPGHGYRKLSLSVIGDIAWAPTASGAQGPLRSEPMDAATAAAAHKSEILQREMDHRFSLGPASVEPY